MVGIKHHTQTAKPDDPTKDVSADEWNEEHDKGTIADVLTDHNKAVHDALNIDAATLETSTKAQVQDHTPKAHTLASHSTKAHSELTGVTASQHHRAYNWFDEWGWKKSVLLPLSGEDEWTKYGEVIARDSLYSIAHPSAYYDGNTLYLYVTRNEEGDTFKGIDLYRSTNWVTFTFYGTVIERGAGGTFDDEHVGIPKVIYDPYESDSAKKWKMWYHAYDGAIYRCGYAYSADGLSWTKYGACTDANYYRYGYAVTRIGKKYFGWMVGSDFDLWLRTSDDGITWTQYGEVLARGAGGSWDDQVLAYPSDFWFLGVHYLLYAGREAATGDYCIGVALSSDGFHGTDGGAAYWKWQFNPMVKSPLTNHNLNCPAVVPFEGEFKMYLAERQNDSRDSISLFTLP